MISFYKKHEGKFLIVYLSSLMALPGLIFDLPIFYLFGALALYNCAILLSEPDQVEDIALIVLPFISFLGFLFATYTLIKRSVSTRGICALSHNWELKKDSESEKWKNGRRPLMISRSGYTKYECLKCAQKLTKRWRWND